MQITSTFGLLDVTDGRQRLSEYLGYREEQPPIPVVIHAEITHAWGHDDGESQEFVLRVTKIETLPQG